MNALTKALVLLACAGLAAGQVSGMHAHLDADGFGALLRSGHVHLPVRAPLDAGAHVGHADEHLDHGDKRFAGHDHRDYGGSSETVHGTPGQGGGEEPLHSGEQDVVVAKTTVVPLKIAFAIAVFFLTVALASVATRTVPPPPVTSSLRPGRVRWRPPLRAPPIPLAR